MTQDKNIEALRKVAEEALGCADIKVTLDSVGRQYTHIANSAEVAASIIRLVCAPLLSELAEAGQYTEAHERLDDLARERIAAAEAALASLKEERDEARRQLRDALAVRDAALNAEAAAEQALSVLKGEMGSSWDQSDRGSTGAEEGSCSAGGVGRSVDDILDRVARAYGLLWAVVADGHTRSGQNVQSARRVLSALLTREGMRGGISMLSEDEQPDPQETINVV